MRILGIDPGYAIVGYGVIQAAGGSVPPGGIRGHHHSRGGGLWPAASGNLPGHGEILTRLKPEAAAVEKLYFTNNKTTGIGVAEARGVILLALAQHGVPLYEYTPMQVKQAVTGYGKAVKPQVQEMTRRLLGLQKVPQPDDTADALALAICHGQAAGSPLRKTLLQRGHKPEKVI